MKQMRWHKEGKHDSEDSDIMSHLADGEASHTLDRFDLEFVRDLRSVHLGLSMNGFQLHDTDSRPYSSWPVFIVPYNLPPNKFLKQGFIFLALVIPGLKESKKQMNIFLRLLMEEMKDDSHLKCRFNLCDVYLWLIHDYLTYDKYAYWCVHSRLNCLICMDDYDTFRWKMFAELSYFHMQICAKQVSKAML
jgi:hypothetical protein